jgi:hypothetical protein
MTSLFTRIRNRHDDYKRRGEVSQEATDAKNLYDRYVNASKLAGYDEARTAISLQPEWETDAKNFLSQFDTVEQPRKVEIEQPRKALAA